MSKTEPQRRVARFLRGYKSRRRPVLRGPHPGRVTIERVRLALSDRPSPPGATSSTSNDTSGHTLPPATQALAAAAYRSFPSVVALDFFPGSRWLKGFSRLFVPDSGEAYAQAILRRTLGSRRPALIQSFGTSATSIAEHCLEATTVRRHRDNVLSVITFFTCWLFLPGALIWLLALSISMTIPRLGRVPMISVALIGFWLLCSPPVDGGAVAAYVRLLLAVPYIGWLVAKTLCLRTAEKLRERAAGVCDGSSVAAKVPEPVPTGSSDTKAENFRRELSRLEAEENSNIVLYDEDDEVLGIGSRWGTWSLEEELYDRCGRLLVPFHNWDIVRRVVDLMRSSRDSNDAAFTVDHWAAFPSGGLPLSRPNGIPEIEAFRLKNHELQRLSNEAATPGPARYFLVAQCPLQGGQYIITLLISVVIRDWVLRVSIDAHALGPVSAHLCSPPDSHWVQVTKGGRFYCSESPSTTSEILRLMARAPFTLFPAGVLNRLGGTLMVPEPFGVRFSAAHRPWSDDFPTDEALRTATTVLKSLHHAILMVLAENSVDLGGQRTGDDIERYTFARA